MSMYLTSRDVSAAALALDVPVATIQAVTRVESSGSGFIRGTDLPKILFEGHHFHRLTDGRFDEAAPNLSYSKWTKKFYEGGRDEYDRLLGAIDRDLDAALQSTSWGLFQIMGFNYSNCGFSDVTDYVNAIAESEGAQLAAFIAFIQTTGLASFLRDQQWETFAQRYNGPAFKKNEYDSKLAAEFSRARSLAEEGRLADQFRDQRGNIAALQAALNVAADAGLSVDGWWGPATETAVIRFQRAEGLEPTGEVDQALLDRLGFDPDQFGLIDV